MLVFVCLEMAMLLLCVFEMAHANILCVWGLLVLLLCMFWDG